MTRVLVTGASGRLGRAVVAHLSATGFDVRPAPSPREGGADLDDRNAVAALLEASKATVVVHLGGVVPSSASDPASFDVNWRSAKWLAELAPAAGIARIVLASTAAIYGDSRTSPVTEQAAPDLRSPYAESKLAAEQALQDSSCETVSLRLFNVFGPALDDSLVARLERSTVDEPAHLRTLDDFVRDYVHSDDVARAVEAAMVRPLPERHTVLNVGSGVPTSNRAVLEAVSARQPVHWQLVDGPPSYSVADMSLAGRVLGFVPPVRL